MHDGKEAVTYRNRILWILDYCYDGVLARCGKGCGAEPNSRFIVADGR
jgi:hypothetical protein